MYTSNYKVNHLTFLWYILRVPLWQSDVWKLFSVAHHHFVKNHAVHCTVIFKSDLLLQVF